MIQHPGEQTNKFKSKYHRITQYHTKKHFWHTYYHRQLFSNDVNKWAI